MGLPSPQLLQELAKIVEKERPLSGTALENQLRALAHPSTRPTLEEGVEEQLRGLTRSRSFSVPESRPMSDSLANYAKKGAQILPSTGASFAVGKAVHSGISVGLDKSVQVLGQAIPLSTHLLAVGTAVSAWINIATVAVQASKVFDLYTLRDDARGARSGPTAYACKCQKCASNIQYIIDKKERNVAIVAVSVGTAGVAKILKGIHSLGKKVKSKIMGETRPKEEACRELVQSAQNGCLSAMATIFLLSGSWTQGYRDRKTMQEAIVTIMSENGWEKLRSNF